MIRKHTQQTQRRPSTTSTVNKRKPPESSGANPDHFVGGYYVQFEQKFQEEYKQWQQTDEGQAVFQKSAKEGLTPEVFFKGYSKKYFNDYSKLGEQAREMLLKWEANDTEVRALWGK